MPDQSSKRRSSCPISFALEIFGDRWTLLVLRDLLLKGRFRYKELLAADEGIATNILSDRLKRLERKGLIRREVDPGDRRQFLYRPTESAVALVPMLVEMIVWGLRNDPHAIKDASFVEAFDADRDGLIDSLMEAARSRLC